MSILGKGMLRLTDPDDGKLTVYGRVLREFAKLEHEAGVPPTMPELAKKLRLASAKTNQLVLALAEYGYVEHKRRGKSAIRSRRMTDFGWKIAQRHGGPAGPKKRS